MTYRPFKFHSAGHRLLAAAVIGSGLLASHASALAQDMPPETPDMAMQSIDTTLPKHVNPIESAPSVTAKSESQIPSLSTLPSTASKTLLAPTTEANAPWVLDGQTHPWPLSYLELVPMNTLVITLPTEAQARIMLPGYVADAAGRAAFTVNRYVTDVIASATLTRTRQLETFNIWAANVEKQKLTLPKDPWAEYQFNKEARATASGFKEKIVSQTLPTVQRMAVDVKAAIEKIAPIMNVMSAYEQQMQWYNVLVQIKEGVELYQSRVTEADSRVLAAVAEFEQLNPTVVQPQGSPPPKPGERVAAPLPQLTPAVSAIPAPSNIQRLPAAEPPAATETGQHENSSGGTLILALVFLIMGFGIFMKMRKLLKKKGSVAESS